jgi:hypothetical protein
MDVNVRTVGAQFSRSDQVQTSKISKIYLTLSDGIFVYKTFIFEFGFFLFLVYFISSCYKEWSRCWSWQENSHRWAFLINCLWLSESELLHMGMGHQWLHNTPHEPQFDNNHFDCKYWLKYCPPIWWKSFLLIFFFCTVIYWTNIFKCVYSVYLLNMEPN